MRILERAGCAPLAASSRASTPGKVTSAARDGPPAMLDTPEDWPPAFWARTKYRAGKAEARSSTKKVSVVVPTSTNGPGTPRSPCRVFSRAHTRGTASQIPWTVSTIPDPSSDPPKPMISRIGITVARYTPYPTAPGDRSQERMTSWSSTSSLTASRRAGGAGDAEGPVGGSFCHTCAPALELALPTKSPAGVATWKPPLRVCRITPGVASACSPRKPALERKARLTRNRRASARRRACSLIWAPMATVTAAVASTSQKCPPWCSQRTSNCGRATRSHSPSSGSAM